MSNVASPATESDQRTRSSGQPVVVPIRGTADADPLASFSPERETARLTAPTSSAPPEKKGQSSILKPLLTIVVAAFIVSLAGIAAVRYSGIPTSIGAVSPVKPLTGRVVLNSRPSGAAVTIDGVARGVTPLELELPTGAHDVIFSGDNGERRLSVTVESSTRTSENVDMPAATASTGEIDVSSSPAGANVVVDGKASGRTPLKLRSLAPGQHIIELTQGSSTVTRTVDLSAGGSLNVFVSLAAGAAAAGMFAVDSPVELRLVEKGQLLGVSGAVPLTLAAGRHQLEFVNDTLELRVSRTVAIEPGKTTRVNVPMPNGILFANAAPWAEVFVDGRSLGVTPLGNISVPVGSHQVVWRNPQFGERQQTVTVGARTPARLSMEFSK